MMLMTLSKSLLMTELKNYKMFIGGEWLVSDTHKTFETLNPENNKPWAKVPEASSGDVDKACLLYTSPSPRDEALSRMPSSA